MRMPTSWIVVLALLLACVLPRAATAAESVAATKATPTFDHQTTGFELLGQHRDLSCESCHISAVFKGTPTQCSACHGVGTAVRATAKSTNHVQSSDRCDACHNSVAWIPAVTFDHVEVQGSCSSCHNNVQALGKPLGHINTTQECNTCHTTLSWAGASFNHAGVTGGCASCHNGTQASGLPTGHIPTGGAPCESCHSVSNFSNWTGAVMNHGAVKGIACDACHESGMSFIGVTIVTRPPLPHPAGGDCGLCHLSTTSFKSGLALPANHIPLPAADSGNCVLCHSNPANFAVYSMNHVNIASNCAQCHATGLSFANMAPPTLKQPPTNHIPFAGASCESCHAATSTSTGGFMMTNNDAHMNHAVVSSLVCSTCHESGLTWAGTPPTVTRPQYQVPGNAGSGLHVTTGECSTCHFNTTSFLGATNFPANHIPLPAADNNTCTLCHTSASDYTIYTMNHVNISSNCAQCHAAGLSFTNMAPPTLKELPSNHVPVGSVACERLSRTDQFLDLPWYGDEPCEFQDQLHRLPWRGIELRGPGGADSSDAYTDGDRTVRNLSFHQQLHNVFRHGDESHGDHQRLRCLSRLGFDFLQHGAADSEGAAHQPHSIRNCRLRELSRRDFDCHRRFRDGEHDADMNHTVVTSLVCSTCHEAGKSWAGTPATVTRPVYLGPGNSTSGLHVTTGECSTCHFNTTSFLGATNLPANHIPLPAADGSNCALCHSDSSNYATYAMNHVNISSNCAQCHASGLSSTNMAPPTLKQPPTNHIPFASAACESCHAATSTATGGFVMANDDADMNHTVVTSLVCSTCHEAGLTWAGTPATVTRPQYLVPGNSSSGLHVTTGECSNCHLNTTSFLGATALQPTIFPCRRRIIPTARCVIPRACTPPMSWGRQGTAISPATAPSVMARG